MLQFESEILEDISWRNEQLLFAKTIPHIYSFSKSHKEFVVKHSIPIIYAIWEGFVQSCFQTYVRELNKLGLKRKDFCENIITHTVDSVFPQLKEYPKEFNKRVKFINKLNDFFENEFSVSSIIKTESNVELEMLNKILYRFSLEEIPTYPYKIQLKDLLKFRNRIAHGDTFLIVDDTTIDDFIGRIDEFVVLVRNLMDLVFENISKGYRVEKSYLNS
jgi:hypothetical protein